jgi:hypothetical protein
MTVSNMTLAAFNGTPVLDDGKVAIRSFDGRAASNRKNSREIPTGLRFTLPHLRFLVKRCEE